MIDRHRDVIANAQVEENRQPDYCSEGAGLGV